MSSRFILFIACLVLFHFHAEAQRTDTTGLSELTVPEAPPEKVYELWEVEKPPIFPGGEQALMKYIATNMIFPTFDRTNDLPGTIVISFVIDKNGKVGDAKIIKGSSPKVDICVLDFIRGMPDWQAGTINGRSVAVQYKLPIKINWQ